MSEAAGSPPEVIVVVLNWNGLDDTLRCLGSLECCRYENLSILVVDNGSRSSPASAIRERHPSVEVVESPTNLGYAGGNNLGIRRAIARGADYVWILNNDTEVDEDALGPLVTEAESDPAVGAVGGKVLRADDPNTLWVTWGRVTWLQSLVALEGEGETDGPRFDGAHDVAWIPGCSILFRAKALEEVGAFDADFFAYHEDADWAARSARQGWRCRYTGASRVYHRIHGSSGGSAHYGGFRKYLSARNSVLYARKHGRLHHKIRLAVAIVVTLPFQFLRRALTGEAGGIVMKVRGWRDALLGRPIPLRELGLR